MLIVGSKSEEGRGRVSFVSSGAPRNLASDWRKQKFATCQLSGRMHRFAINSRWDRGMAVRRSLSDEDVDPQTIGGFERARALLTQCCTQKIDSAV